MGWGSSGRAWLVLERAARTEKMCPVFARQNQGAQRRPPPHNALWQLGWNRAHYQRLPIALHQQRLSLEMCQAALSFFFLFNA